MDALFGHLNYWDWWILAVILLVLELLTPATFFMFMGVAAAIVGLLLWLIPMSWEWQVLIYAALSVAVTVTGRVYVKRRPIATDRPTLNRRGAQYVGRSFILTEPMVNGSGKIHVDDSTWKVSGPDCAAGGRVRVIGVDGTVLQVEVDDK